MSRRALQFLVREKVGDDGAERMSAARIAKVGRHKLWNTNTWIPDMTLIENTTIT